MNRRDTIVVAVLINAGVLIVLFTSALKTRSVEDQLAANKEMMSPPIVQELAIQNEKELPIRDEVDSVLTQLAAQQRASNVEMVNSPGASESADFSSDLNRFIPQNDPSAIAAPTVPIEQALPSMPRREFVDVKVKKGDALAKIAKRYHCSVDQIMKLNKLTTSNLRIGQMLKVPTPISSTAPTAKAPNIRAPNVNVPEGTKLYVVKSGESPWSIAHKNKMSVTELLRLNHMDAEKAKRLKPGDKLIVK